MELIRHTLAPFPGEAQPPFASGLTTENESAYDRAVDERRAQVDGPLDGGFGLIAWNRTGGFLV